MLSPPGLNKSQLDIIIDIHLAGVIHPIDIRPQLGCGKVCM